MFEIVKKEKIAENISKIDVYAPHVAKAAKPGQFVVVIPSQNAERIPLTIADFNLERGTISIIFQIVGATTKVLDSLKEGEALCHLLGPLGVPSEIEKFGRVVVIGGGVGIAEIYPVVRALRNVGNEVITIIGARTQSLLIFQEELRSVSSCLLVTTDDGSAGRKGFVSDELKELLNKGLEIKRVIAVGPVPMMKVCCEVTRPYSIKTMVSLNPIMLDATGMCGVCRVVVGRETKFACVDGPEFDGHEVDFEELTNRLRMYKDLERHAFEHVCRLLEKSEKALG